MGASVQLPTLVQAELNALLARKHTLVVTARQIQLAKVTYIKDMRELKAQYVSAKTSQAKQIAFAAAQKCYIEFTAKIRDLTSTTE